MCELGIKTCNVQEDSLDNIQESELTLILGQDTMQNSKSHFYFVSVFQVKAKWYLAILFQLQISLATNRKRLGEEAQRKPQKQKLRKERSQGQQIFLNSCFLFLLGANKVLVQLICSLKSRQEVGKILGQYSPFWEKVYFAFQSTLIFGDLRYPVKSASVYINVQFSICLPNLCMQGISFYVLNKLEQEAFYKYQGSLFRSHSYQTNSGGL